MSDSTNSTSSLFSGLRMGGFATGLDTESLVKAMATTSKSRLNRQQQKYDTLSWKQEASVNSAPPLMKIFVSA